jgi:DNA-binding NtrC family response regulator
MNGNNKPFLFGAVVGSGLVAKAADNAHADYLLALNAGRFRIQGASSLSCFLPARSANEWVMEFSQDELLGRFKAPVYAGLSVSDPAVDIMAFVQKMKAMGFAGVCNFPTATSIDGSLANLIEREGLGFTRELELARLARTSGLDVFAYVQTNQQAHQMMDAGANNICVNIGFTGGATGVRSQLTLQSAARKIDRVLDGIDASVAKLCHGGPITSPEHALTLMKNCQVQGFIAGSTLDRLPFEIALHEVTKSFMAIPKLTGVSNDIGEAETESLVGSSSAIRAIRAELSELSPDDTPVLISGDTGTGKSQVANYLHNLSPASTKKPIVVDCPSLDVSDGGRHLLGHTADQQIFDSPGALERSNGGPLILEDVNSLPKALQGKLLSFMDTCTVTRIGEHEPREARSRVISTTTIDPQQLSESENFRIDLYYRLAGHLIILPPLRERREDIPELALHFARAATEEKSLVFSNAALDILIEHNWNGNVRELKHVVHRALRKCSGNMVTRRALNFLTAPLSSPPKDSVSATSNAPASEKNLLLEALTRNAYHRAKTAEELGITTRTLYNKIKKFGIEA